jgi:hypothetical protein
LKLGDVPLLEVARLFDDALKDALSHGGAERAPGGSGDALEQVVLAGGVVHVEPEPPFHLSDAHHQPQSFRKELQDLPIELVDRLSQLRDARLHARNLAGAARQQQPQTPAMQPTALIFLRF